MGWTSKPPPPDPNIGLAEKQQADLATQQQNFYQTNIAPAELQQMQQDTQIAGQEAAAQENLQNYQLGVSQQLNDQYQKNFAPVVNQVATDAQQADSSGYQQGLVDQATTTAGQQYASTNAGLQRDLAARGIDPGSGSAVAAMAGSRDAEGLARAQAANSTRLAAKQMGWTAAENAAGIGSGLVGSTLGASTASSNSGLNAATAAASGMNAVSSAGGINNNFSNSQSSNLNSLGELGVSNYSAGVQATQAANGPMNAVVGAVAGGLTAAATGGLSKFLAPPPAPAPSDRRLKRDIRRIGATDYGVALYSYKFAADPTGRMHVGVMADELEKVRPEAVHKRAIAGEFDAVDYSMV